MPDEVKFTHIAIERATQRKIAILATLKDQKIYEMIAGWTDEQWKAAKQAGLVKESMLEPEAA